MNHCVAVFTHVAPCQPRHGHLLTVFQHHQRARPQPLAGHSRRQSPRAQPCPIRRVGKHNIEPRAVMPPQPAGILALQATHGRSPGTMGKAAQGFATGALQNAAGSTRPVVAAQDWSGHLIKAARTADTRIIATAYPPVGPVAARLAASRTALTAEGIELRLVRIGAVQRVLNGLRRRTGRPPLLFPRGPKPVPDDDSGRS